LAYSVSLSAVNGGQIPVHPAHKFLRMKVVTHMITTSSDVEDCVYLATKVNKINPLERDSIMAQVMLLFKLENHEDKLKKANELEQKIIDEEANQVDPYASWVWFMLRLLLQVCRALSYCTIGDSVNTYISLERSIVMLETELPLTRYAKGFILALDETTKICHKIQNLELLKRIMPFLGDLSEVSTLMKKQLEYSLFVIENNSKKWMDSLVTWIENLDDKSILQSTNQLNEELLLVMDENHEAHGRIEQMHIF